MTAPGPDALERNCDIEFFVAGGPGGQHRNRTASGVRLRHRPTGIVIVATERRSQHRNRDVALERLRERLARLARRRRARVRTRPTAASRERRITAKKQRSSVKRARGAPPED